MDKEAYVAVNIMATGTATKAPGDYVAGTAAENAVKNALFLFYDAAGNPATYAAPAIDGSWSPAEPQSPTDDGNNVATKTTVLVLENTLYKPASMLVILNYDPTVAKLTAADGYHTKTLSAMKNELTGLKYNDGVDDYYTMTNSVYAKGTATICEVSLAPENFQTTPELAKTYPVSAYVERVAAKIDVDVVSVANNPTQITLDGTPNVSLTPIVTGYEIVETPSTSYLFKNIDPNTWNTAWPAWTNDAEFRSFWALMPDKAYYEINNPAHSAIVKKTNFVDYYYENTSGQETTTKLLVAVQLKKDGTEEVDFVKYAGMYYSLETFKQMTKDALSSEVVITPSTMFEVVAHNASPSKRFEMHLQLNDSYTGGDKETLNASLEARKALYWEKGKAYYYVDVQSGSSVEGYKSGVVRNHYYDIDVNSISGLGVPVPDASASIDPEPVAEEQYNVAATINILEWKIVSQEVNFEM